MKQLREFNKNKGSEKSLNKSIGGVIGGGGES